MTRNDAPTLFDAAAEQAALSSGRPKSQERADLFATETAGAGFRCLRDHQLTYHRKLGLVCLECDAIALPMRGRR